MVVGSAKQRPADPARRGNDRAEHGQLINNQLINNQLTKMQRYDDYC
jgi:hypothetical protein